MRRANRAERVLGPVAAAMVDAGIADYLLHIGACRPRRDGSDLLLSASAVAAVTADECAQACTAHGDACKSASWYLAGNTTFLKVTSRCWLSSACVRPDCCHDGFDTHVKAQHVRPSPPPPPPFMRLARRGQRAVHARAGRQVLVRATARRDVTHGAQDYTTTRASLSLHERARE